MGAFEGGFNSYERGGEKREVWEVGFMVIVITYDNGKYESRYGKKISEPSEGGFSAEGVSLLRWRVAMLLLQHLLLSYRRALRLQLFGLFPSFLAPISHR